MIGTGARPVRPDLPGIDGALGPRRPDPRRRRPTARSRRGEPCRDVVVVGAGYIGLEMAEAFIGAARPCHGGRGRRPGDGHARRRTWRAGSRDAMPRLGHRAAARRAGQGVRARRSSARPTAALAADLVVLGLGVEPNSELAGDAGIELGVARRDPGRPAAAHERRRRVGRRGLLPTPSTSCPDGACTSPSARWPTARPASPASTSPAATRPSPVSSAPPSPEGVRDRGRRAPASPRPSAPRPASGRGGDDREHDPGRLLPDGRGRSP